MAQLHAQTIFSAAQTHVQGLPFNNAQRTLRLVIQSALDGEAISLVFSNAAGDTTTLIGAASVAECDEHGTLVPGTLRPITVGGLAQFSLTPGEEIESDSVAFPLTVGGHFALNLYYPESAPVHSGNWLGNTALRSRPGNFSADLTIPGAHLASRFIRSIVGADMAVALTNIAQVLAHRRAPAKTLACFGDSITQQCTWTVPFAKRLAHAFPGEIALCNLGIGGNRLLRDGPESLRGLYGEAGVSRFGRDLLGIRGLTHAVLALGANDIGLPGSHGLPVAEVPTLAAYTTTLEQMANTLHERNVTVYAATITPRTPTDVYTAEREVLRGAMNEWIRTAPCFDAVLDFDAVLRRDDTKPGMRDKFAQPDGLHPTPLGGLFLAKSIPLSLFAEGGRADG